MSEAVIILLLFYLAICLILNVGIGCNISYYWEEIKENGLKIKHIVFMVVFFPTFLLLGLMMLMVLPIALISESKLWSRLKGQLNKTIWKS